MTGLACRHRKRRRQIRKLVFPSGHPPLPARGGRLRKRDDNRRRIFSATSEHGRPMGPKTRRTPVPRTLLFSERIHHCRNSDDNVSLHNNIVTTRRGHENYGADFVSSVARAAHERVLLGGCVSHRARGVMILLLYYYRHTTRRHRSHSRRHGHNECTLFTAIRILSRQRPTGFFGRVREGPLPFTLYLSRPPTPPGPVRLAGT